MFQNLKMRMLLSLLAMVILAFVFALPTNEADAINTPWLSVSGRYIKDTQGNNVELRGVSLVDVGVADSRSRNARQLIDMVTNETDGWYARVVRLPVYPEAIDYTPGWNANPDAYFNDHLNPAIQECVARQIYCIIDWHYISDYTSSAINTSTRNFWSYVAPRYANTPNVIFELFNEPMNPDSWSTWRSTAQPWVDLIRSYAPNNLILIGGPRWSQNLSSAASQPFTGSNLVYVAHIYPEHGGQSTWDSWFGNAANSVPFFVTEWGWQQGGNTPTSGTTSGYGIPFSNYLESKGLSWTAWVFDQWWQPVMFDTNYNLLGGESYMGQYTKDLLYQHRNEGLPGGVQPTTPPPTTPPPTTPPPTTQPGQAPYGGTPWAIPGTIQAENYDTGGEGVAYQDTTAGNSGNAYRTTERVDVESTTDSGGGYNVGWTAAGEWLEYTVNVAASGTYTLNARVASQSSGGTIHVEVDGVNVTGALAIPSTGGWQTWTTITRTGITLSAGQHVMRIAEDSAGFNVNWVSLTGGGTPPPTTPPPTTPPPTTPPPTTPPPTTPPPTTPPPTTPPPTTPPPTTPPPGGACSPVTSTISVPFTFDGAGTFCWQTSNLGSYVNSWNLTSLTINGVNFTNRWVGAGSYPPAINGYWYVSYKGAFAWSHLEVR